MLARTALRSVSTLFIALLLLTALSTLQASAQTQQQPPAPVQPHQNGGFTADEVIDAGNNFFGSASSGLASTMQNAFSKYGLPNGYILGSEGSGAFIAGLTYGEGQLNTKNAGVHKVFWQGPSLGIDYGGDGSRVMMLVYNLPSVPDLFRRYGGVSGSAYVVAGFSMQVYTNRNIVIVPVRSGVGARLGVNVGYLKLTQKPTWNPF
nr:EipA family protein [Marinicella sp. W31]MDC2879798.1 EipA family protein [Marinicella sp. W31]